MKRILVAAIPYAVFLVLLLVSWNRWIEPYVDTGRELMVPWRVSRGEVLYRDIQFYHGPLAPYLGALVDRIAGRSLPARIALAAGIALLHLEVLRRLALRLLSPLRASLVASLTVATALFLRPGGWLFPFSFDTAIAVAALTAVLFFQEKGTARADAAAAGCLAAVLASRLELGLAGAAILLWTTRRQPRRWKTLVGIPLLTAAGLYLFLSAGIPLEKLVRDGWLALISPPEAFRNVYRAYAGLDRPGLRLAELAIAAIFLVLLAGFLAVAAAIAARAHDPRSKRAIESVVIALPLFAVLLALRPPASLASTFWLLPPLVRVVPPLVLGATLATLALRQTTARDLLPGVSDAMLLVASFFSLRLLLAAGYVGPYDAFFLPLPLVVSAALALRAADSAAPLLGAALPRMTASALAIFLIGRAGAMWSDYRARVWGKVQTPAGAVRLPEPVAGTTQLVVDDLSRHLPPGARLVGFPEGGFFNYALGFASPLPFEQFFPGHVEGSSEERDLIRRLASSPPDAVIIANVLAVGEDRPAFGKDYLVDLDRFLRSRFAVAACHGPGARPDAHVGDPQFFVMTRIPAVP